MPLAPIHVDELQAALAPALRDSPPWYADPATVLAVLKYGIERHDFELDHIKRYCEHTDDFGWVHTEYQDFLKHLCPRCDGAGKLALATEYEADGNGGRYRTLGDSKRCGLCRGRGRLEPKP